MKVAHECIAELVRFINKFTHGAVLHSVQEPRNCMAAPAACVFGGKLT